MSETDPIFRTVPPPWRRFVRSDDGPETAVLLNGRTVRGRYEDRGSGIEDGTDPSSILDPTYAVFPNRSAFAFLADRVTCPDLAGQLAATDRIDTIICGILDTDPSVPVNVTAASTFPAELSAGLHYLIELTGAPKTRVAADPTKAAEWFAGVKTRPRPPGVKAIPLRGDYPQTDPTLMLFSVLDKRLRPGVSPTSLGVLLLDAVAAIEVGRWAAKGITATSTLLAVRDHFTATTHYVDAPIGCRLGNLCESLGIDSANVVARGGDFLRDCLIPADAVVGGGESVVHLSAPQLAPNPDPCIRCGWCVEACPTRCHPAGLLAAAQADDRDLAGAYGLSACIECGICDYVCPTRLPLLSAIRGMRPAGR